MLLASTVVALSGCGGTHAGDSSISTATPGPSTSAAVAMPVGDTPGWHQVFADNFTQNVPLGSFPSAVQSRWGNSYPDGWSDTTRHGVYMPSRVVSIDHGILNIHVHTENGKHLVAGLLPTIPGTKQNRGGFLYGKYVVRLRADYAPGYKASVLLWPDSGTWPRDGEIDFPEGDLDSSIHGYVHLQGATTANDQTEAHTGEPFLSWHTATVTWLPGVVTFALDGQVVAVTRGRVPNTPMHVVIQVETATQGLPPPPATSQGNVQFAWITVYTPACNRAMSIKPSVAACASGL
jgi:hypothetical protein